MTNGTPVSDVDPDLSITGPPRDEPRALLHPDAIIISHGNRRRDQANRQKRGVGIACIFVAVLLGLLFMMPGEVGASHDPVAEVRAEIGHAKVTLTDAKRDLNHARAFGTVSEVRSARQQLRGMRAELRDLRELLQHEIRQAQVTEQNIGGVRIPAGHEYAEWATGFINSGAPAEFIEPFMGLDWTGPNTIIFCESTNNFAANRDGIDVGPAQINQIHKSIIYSLWPDDHWITSMLIPERNGYMAGFLVKRKVDAGRPGLEDWYMSAWCHS